MPPEPLFRQPVPNRQRRALLQIPRFTPPKKNAVADNSGQKADGQSLNDSTSSRYCGEC